MNGRKMTETQRRILIGQLIREHTETHTVTRAAARASLIAEGIYTQKGTLRAEYGGGSKKGKSAA